MSFPGMFSRNQPFEFFPTCILDVCTTSQKAKQRMATAAPLLLDHVINPNHDSLGHSAVFSGPEGNLFCVHCASDRLSLSVGFGQPPLKLFYAPFLPRTLEPELYSR